MGADLKGLDVLRDESEMDGTNGAKVRSVYLDDYGDACLVRRSC